LNTPVYEKVAAYFCLKASFQIRIVDKKKNTATNLLNVFCVFLVRYNSEIALTHLKQGNTMARFIFPIDYPENSVGKEFEVG
jgi:hypothetical protein